MTRLLTKEDAATILDSHLGDLAFSMREAVASYHDERQGKRPLSPRTRACIISDYASQNAATTLAGHPDVKLIWNDDETLIMIFEDRAIVRIKKLNRDLKISCIPTEQAKSWVAQEPLENFPEATNLVAGYTLDEFGQLDRLLLICSKHNRRMWVLDLDDVAGEASLLNFPVSGQPQPGQVVVRSDRHADGGAEEAVGNA
jgi:hypothetical protein